MLEQVLTARHNFTEVVEGGSPCREGKVEAAKEFADRMRGIREGAEAALRKAVADMKKGYDRQHSPSPDYKVGDRIGWKRLISSPIAQLRSWTMNVNVRSSELNLSSLLETRRGIGYRNRLFWIR